MRIVSYEQLCHEALRARELSYSPYSHFQVGAALVTDDDIVFTGCNIENAAYSPSVCAERTAFYKAISEGKRHFKAIAIAGGPEHAERPLQPCPPCGVCRQVMMEFCDPKTFEVILVQDEGLYQIELLENLMPRGFGPHIL